MRRPVTAFVVVLLLLTAACGTDPTGASSTTAPIGTTTTATTTPTSSPGTTAPSVGATPARYEIVGESIEGRPIVASEFGAGPHRVFVIGGIHGDERTGVDTSLALLEHLQATLRDEVTVRWLVDVNPDGSAANTRDNAAGVDINRNWPTEHFPSESHGSEPLSEPETRTLLAQIESFDPEVIIAMHSAREGPFANYDGPGADLAAAFAAGASGDRVWEVVPSVDWPTPGSLGTHFGMTVGVPVITVEGSRWDDPAAVLPELEGGFDAMLDALVDGVYPDAPVCTDHLVGNTCDDLSRRVRSAASDDVLGGTYGFLLKEAGGRVLAARWADFRTYPASSIKIVHFLHLMNAGGDDPAGFFDTTVPFDPSCAGTGATGSARLGDLVEAMLIESDNSAANALQNWIGLSGVEATAATAGMVSTRIVHGFGCGGPANDPANVSTIADLVTLYDRVVTGRLLDTAATDLFIDSLLDVTDDVLTELGIDDAPGARIVAKAGWYDRNLSIAGIAFTPAGTYVFGAYTDRPQGLLHDYRIERTVAELLRDLITRPAG